MKYLKLFESATKEDIRATIIEMLNDDSYFKRYSPYPKRKEQFKRLMMMICHKKSELENASTVLKGSRTNGMEVTFVDLLWETDQINILIGEFIKEKMVGVIEEANKYTNNIKEVLVEMVLKDINKKDNIQIYKDWIYYDCVKEQIWLVNHPDLIQYKRQLDANLWDFKNKTKND